MTDHGLTFTVDTDNFRHNYLTFRSLCPDAEVSAVVKADAYGCGLKVLAPVLEQLNCRTFFVAHLSEAVELRRQIKNGAIYVLNGLLPETESAYRDYNIRPVITSQSQLYHWLNFCCRGKWYGGAALHIDTGINRMGFRSDEVSGLRELSVKNLSFFDLLISHLACADEPEDTRNQDQIEKFTWARRQLGAIPRASLASSAGCFLGESAHFDMVRPGIGLFGGNPFSDRDCPFKAVSSVSVPLLQVKKHRAGDFVGYGNTCRLEIDTLVGAISVGYADGLPRSAMAAPLNFYYRGNVVPTLGRISMDMTLVDLSSIVSLKPRVGDAVEIFGAHRSVNDFARLIDTIPNEILTSFSRRAKRQYVGRVASYASVDTHPAHMALA